MTVKKRGMTKGEPVIVQCAITGSQPLTDKNPNLPANPDQIAESAVMAARAGAAIVHIHARDEDGTPTGELAPFTRIVDQIRKGAPDVIINLSTGSGGGVIAGSDRWACTELKPEIASYDCGSLNFGDRIFENSRPFLKELAAALKAQGCLPEIECFEIGHVEQALDFQLEGVLEGRLYYQFVLGVPGGAKPTLANIAYLRDLLPEGSVWSLCGVGPAQLPLGLVALASGGHVRTGMEDNLMYAKGQPAESNAQLVERIVRLAGEVGRPVATPDIAREILGLTGS